MANTYLHRTFTTPTNNKKWTYSFWIKKSSVATHQALLSCGADNNNRGLIYLTSSGKLYYYETTGGIDSTDIGTNRLFRDPSSWYHIVYAVDTTQATEANRVKVYVNGVQETSLAVINYPNQNDTNYINSGIRHDISGRNHAGSSDLYFDGSMSHVHFIDGTAYDASAFGETDTTTGEWKAKTSPSVTYGTNGFLILKDGNTITDQSSNSNAFTLGGGTLTDLKDNPDNVFATMNPLANTYPGSTFAYGNTQTAMPASNNSFNVSTLGMPSTSGKFYAEVKILVPSQYTEIGISSGGSTASSGGLGRTTSTSGNYEWGYTNGNQVVRHNGGAMSWSGVNYTTNDIVAVALDNDNQKIYWSVNGVYQNSGVPTSGATGTGALSTSTVPSFYHFAGGDNHSSGDPTNTILQWNFGNGFFGTTAITTNSGNGYAGAEGASKFNYTVPTGYSALSTKGLNE